MNTYLIIFSQNILVFQYCLSNILDFLRQSHRPIVIEWPSNRGQVDVVGEKKEQSLIESLNK